MASLSSCHGVLSGMNVQRWRLSYLYKPYILSEASVIILNRSHSQLTKDHFSWHENAEARAVLRQNKFEKE